MILFVMCSYEKGKPGVVEGPRGVPQRTCEKSASFDELEIWYVIFVVDAMWGIWRHGINLSVRLPANFQFLSLYFHLIMLIIQLK